jgi:hypothetical protein
MAAAHGRPLFMQEITKILRLFERGVLMESLRRHLLLVLISVKCGIFNQILWCKLKGLRGNELSLKIEQFKKPTEADALDDPRSFHKITTVPSRHCS